MRTGSLAVLAALAGLIATEGLAKENLMKVDTAPFGTTADGVAVEQYTLAGPSGVRVRLITYGALITSIQAPDRDGRLGEVTLGFDTLEEYLAGHPYFGAVCGRVANRIAGGKFSLDGTEYTLATNNGPNHLHGGINGFDKVVWKGEPFNDADGAGVRLSYQSPDGEEGYPGNLAVTVVYTLTDQDELKIEYTATTDRATPVNLTNHTYWNLANGGAGDILSHRLTLFADGYLPVNEALIPTGKIESVTGTPMDFTRQAAMGDRIDQVGGDPKGYDHCYVLRKAPAKALSLAARVVEPQSGRILEVYTTEPGVQLYTGNFLDGQLRSRGAVFGKHHGFCLETQHFPDSIHQPTFPSTVLRPGETYRQLTVYKFAAR